MHAHWTGSDAAVHQSRLCGQVILNLAAIDDVLPQQSTQPRPPHILERKASGFSSEWSRRMPCRPGLTPLWSIGGWTHLVVMLGRGRTRLQFCKFYMLDQLEVLFHSTQDCYWILKCEMKWCSFMLFPIAGIFFMQLKSVPHYKNCPVLRYSALS